MLRQDIRFALRLLRRDRRFEPTAIVVHAVGIGANSRLMLRRAARSAWIPPRRFGETDI